MNEITIRRATIKLRAREAEVRQSISKLQIKNMMTRNLSKYQALVQKKKKFRRKKSFKLRRRSKSIRATLLKYFVSKYPNTKTVSTLSAQFFAKGSEFNTK